MTAILDERLTGTVTTADLIAIWRDHCPAFTPTPALCEGCGHRYTLVAPLCPTAVIVRTVLWRRRHEYGTQRLYAALTFNQWRDLSDPIEKISTYTRSLTLRDERPAPARAPQPLDDLFDVTPYQLRYGSR